MSRTAVQLYTLREVDATQDELVELVAEAGFDGVEFAGLGEADRLDVAAAIEKTDLCVAGAHVGIDLLEGDAEEVAGTYRPLGCETVVVPYLDESCFADTAAVDATARRLSNLSVALDEHALGLAYHNHDHEFVPMEGRTAYERLADTLSHRVGLELDVGWAVAAGQDPVDLMNRFDDRIPMVHVKDVDASTGEPVDLGEGDVDIEACVRAARKIGSEWLVFEHDEPNDPVASVESAAERLHTVH